MKNYSLKTKESFLHKFKQSKQLRVITGTLLALTVVYFFGNVLGEVVSPITKTYLTIQNYFEQSEAILPAYLRGRNELLTQFQNQNEKLASHSGDEATIARLMEENTELRALLSATGETRIAAGVIARPPRIPYDVLYLDKGTSEGITEGAVVYHALDQAIGYISSVFEHSALVTLFSTPNIETTVYLFGPNIYTTAYGEGGGILRIPIPQGILLSEGTVVVIPSIETGTLGTISRVESIPSEPEQNGYVTFTTPIQSLHYVSVSTHARTPITFEEAQKQITAIHQNLFAIEVPEQFMLKSATSTGTTSQSTQDAHGTGTSTVN